MNAGIPAIKGALNRLRDEDIYDYAIKEGFLRIKGECEGKTLNSEESEEAISSDLIDSSYINSKGCRGSARDKDKDKDQDQEVLKFKDLNKEGGEESNVHKEAEEAEKGTERASGAESAVELFGGIWNKVNKLPEEVRQVNAFINKYGFDTVDFAFKEGVKYNKMSLAYVDAICRKRREKADMAEYRNRDKKKLQESMRLADEQRKSGKCLTLVKDCFGESGLRKVVGR